MRIGAILRMDNTGLGIQSWEFFNHIPCKALVIDFSAMAPGVPILKPYPERFPGQQVFKWGNRHNLTGDIPLDIIKDFVKDIDILFTMETPYDYNFFHICRDRGVKTILQLNYEFLDYPSGLPPPDLFAAPSTWNFDNIPNKKKYLPVPVNLDRFTPIRAEKTFLHIAGRPAALDRNGTNSFLESLRYVKSDITVVLRSQQRISSPCFPTNSNIKVIEDHTIKENYWDNYTGGVLVMPRKYGGLSLPFNEAIAAEMPIITTDISPNEWLLNSWRVESRPICKLHSKKVVNVYEVDPVKLAERIDIFADPDMYDVHRKLACEMGGLISWDALLPKYNETFEEVCSQN